MTSTKKTIIGLLTIAPLFFMIWYFYGIFSFVTSMSNGPGGQGSPNEMMGSIWKLAVPALLMVVISLGTLIYYLVDIFSLNPKFKNDTENSKLIWTLVVLFTGFIGMSVYFFVEIYPRPEVLHRDNTLLDDA